MASLRAEALAFYRSAPRRTGCDRPRPTRGRLTPSLRLYVNENVDQRIVPDLRARGCTMLTVQEAQTGEATDEAQLRCAAEQQGVLVTHNQDHFRMVHCVTTGS